jgi:hypothetical protein
MVQESITFFLEIDSRYDVTIFHVEGGVDDISNLYHTRRELSFSIAVTYQIILW